MNISRVAAGGKGQRYDFEKRGSRESRAVPAPDANAELISSMQVTCSELSYYEFFIEQGRNRPLTSRDFRLVIFPD